jgi:hypothetical protein
LFPGVKNMGPTHASDGVWQESQTTGFLREAGSQWRRKFFPRKRSNLPTLHLMGIA